jgi:ferritin
MDKKLQATFNEQIKNELYSAYLYLSMAAYFESINLPGFAHWMKKQAGEEKTHAMKMFEFLCDRGARVVLEALPAPAVEFSSVKDVFEQTLKHEKKVTALINNLYDLSLKVNDQSSMVFLQWFITEQVEEEKNPCRILEDIKLIKPDSGAILYLDRELAKRE